MRTKTLAGLMTGGMLLAMWSGPVLAAPEISGVEGTVADGQQVYVTGSGFGVKSPAKPFLWAPMEGTHQPTALGSKTSWDFIENTGYAAGEGFKGTGAIKGRPAAGVGETIWTAGVRATDFAWNDYNSRMYLFRRTKQSFTITSQHNWKILRLWPASGTQPNWYVSTNGSLAVSAPIGSAGWPISNPYVAFGAANVWRTEEVLTKSNSASGVSDATYKHFVNGMLVGQLPYGSTTLRFKDDGTSPIVTIYPVHGVEANDANSGVAPAGSSYWVDDVYLDNSWARVMVGNASTLASSTNLEVQIPFEWSSGRIGVVVNIDSFEAGEPAFLFVVDASGNASAGFPVSGAPRPRPPGTVVAE